MAKTTFHTLKEISDSIKVKIKNRSPFSGDSVFADIMSANFLFLQKKIEDIAKEFSPLTASERGLSIWGRIFNIERKESSFAQFKASFPSENNKNAILPNGTKVRTESNDEFELIDGVFFSTRSGEISYLKEKLPVFLIETQLGVKTQGEINIVITIGSNREDLESYRRRVTERIQKPPMGGTKDDYIFWLKQLSFCTDAWTNEKDNKLYLYFLCKTRDNIFPLQEEIVLAREHIKKNRPVTATNVYTVPLSPVKATIKIQGIPKEDRQSLSEAFNKFLINRAEPSKSLTYFDIQKFLIKDAGKENFKLSFDDMSTRDKEVITECEFIWT